MDVRETFNTIADLQNRRLQVHTLFERAFGESQYGILFEQYRAVVNEVTLDFKDVSRQILAIGIALRDAGHEDLAEAVNVIQKAEREKLELVAKRHLLISSAIARGRGVQGDDTQRSRGEEDVCITTGDNSGPDNVEEAHSVAKADHHEIGHKDTSMEDFFAVLDERRVASCPGNDVSGGKSGCSHTSEGSESATEKSAMSDSGQSFVLAANGSEHVDDEVDDEVSELSRRIIKCTQIAADAMEEFRYEID